MRKYGLKLTKRNGESSYDSNFVYPEVGEVVCSDPNYTSKESCGRGLHIALSLSGGLNYVPSPAEIRLVRLIGKLLGKDTEKARYDKCEVLCVLPAQLFKDYQAKIALLYKDYQAKIALLDKDYLAKRDPLYKDYQAKIAPLYKDYQAKIAPLYKDYQAKRDLLDKDYLAKKDPLDKDYQAKKDLLEKNHQAKIALLSKAFMRQAIRYYKSLHPQHSKCIGEHACGDYQVEGYKLDKVLPTK